VGAVIGTRAAVAMPAQNPVAEALAPVAVDGSVSTNLGAVPPNAPAPASVPSPPQSSIPLLNPAISQPERPSNGSPAAPAPRGSAVPAGQSPYSAWAAAQARVIDVPARALQAYAGGTNLTDGTGWWRAILSYNNSTVYVQNVFNGADSYARANVQNVQNGCAKAVQRAGRRGCRRAEGRSLIGALSWRCLC